jgi:hypothetical protein
LARAVCIAVFLPWFFFISGLPLAQSVPSGAFAAVPWADSFRALTEDFGHRENGKNTTDFAVALYKDQLDSASDHAVLLGATRREGLPTCLFTSDAACLLAWVIEEQAEQPHVLDPEAALKFFNIVLYLMACIFAGVALIGLAIYIALLCSGPFSRHPHSKAALDNLSRHTIDTPASTETERLRGEAVRVPALPRDSKTWLPLVPLTLERGPARPCTSSSLGLDDRGL